MKSIITVTCPECEGILEIDVSREKVLSHKRPVDLEIAKGKDKAELFDEQVEKVRKKRSKGDSLFDDALRTVQKSDERLDELFGEVQKKVEEEKKKGIDPDDDPRKLFWD